MTRRKSINDNQTNYVQDLSAMMVQEGTDVPKMKYQQPPHSGVWTGGAGLLEKMGTEPVMVQDSLENIMRTMGRQHGYGNLIAILREHWIDSLVDTEGLSESTATAAAFVSPRSRATRGKS